MEILDSIWKALIEPIVEGLFRHHPVLGTLLGLGLLTGMTIEWVKRRRQKFTRVSLHIHYNYKTRHEALFESLSTIIVLKDGLKEYQSGLGGTRNLTKPITTRNIAMRVSQDANSTGDRKKFTVHFDPPLDKGEHKIPLEGEFTDPNVADPKISFQLMTRLEELVIVTQLPSYEKVLVARASVFKAGKTDYKIRRELWIWRNNVFVAVFRRVKPGYKYEVTWEYEDHDGNLAKRVVSSAV